MKCKNCGVELQENSKFCTNCGTSVDGTITTSSSNNTVTENEELLRSYVGNNYDEIAKKGFSIPALFIDIYMLYRKMYLYYFLAALVFLIALFSGSFLIVWIIIALISGFKMNEIYLSFAQKKVDKIKQSHPGASKEELIAICKKKGGTSLVGPIIYVVSLIVIPIILIIWFVSLVFSYTNQSSEWFEFFKSIFGDYSEIYNYGNEESTDENQNEIEKEDYTVEIGEGPTIQYLIPGSYYKEDNNIYINESSNTTCKIENHYEKTAVSAEDYLKSRVNGNISTNSFNNMLFIKTTKEENNKKIEYYVTKKDDTVFSFIFTDINDTDGICSRGKSKFSNTIRFNEEKGETTISSEPLNKITYTELEKKMLNSESFILLISNQYCSHCNNYKPKLTEVLNEYKLAAYEIDTYSLSNDENIKLNNNFNYSGTPTTIFIKKGSEIDSSRIVGDSSKETIIGKLKELGYINEEKAIGGTM